MENQNQNSELVGLGNGLNDGLEETSVDNELLKNSLGATSRPKSALNGLNGNISNSFNYTTDMSTAITKAQEQANMEVASGVVRSTDSQESTKHSITAEDMTLYDGSIYDVNLGVSKYQSLKNRLNIGDKDFVEYYEEGGYIPEGYETTAKLLYAEEKRKKYWNEYANGDYDYTQFLMNAYGNDYIKENYGDVTSVTYWYNKYKDNDYTNPYEDASTLEEVLTYAEKEFQAESWFEETKSTTDATLNKLASSSQDLTVDQVKELFPTLFDALDDYYHDDEKIVQLYKAGYLSGGQVFNPYIDIDNDGTIDYYYHTNGRLYACEGSSGTGNYKCRVVYGDDGTTVNHINIINGLGTFWNGGSFGQFMSGLFQGSANIYMGFLDIGAAVVGVGSGLFSVINGDGFTGFEDVWTNWAAAKNNSAFLQGETSQSFNNSTNGFLGFKVGNADANWNTAGKTIGIVGSIFASYGIGAALSAGANAASTAASEGTASVITAKIATGVAKAWNTLGQIRGGTFATASIKTGTEMATTQMMKNLIVTSATQAATLSVKDALTTYAQLKAKQGLYKSQGYIISNQEVWQRALSTFASNFAVTFMFRTVENQGFFQKVRAVNGLLDSDNWSKNAFKSVVLSDTSKKFLDDLNFGQVIISNSLDTLENFVTMTNPNFFSSAHSLSLDNYLEDFKQNLTIPMIASSIVQFGQNMNLQFSNGKIVEGSNSVRYGNKLAYLGNITNISNEIIETTRNAINELRSKDMNKAEALNQLLEVYTNKIQNIHTTSQGNTTNGVDSDTINAHLEAAAEFSDAIRGVSLESFFGKDYDKALFTNEMYDQLYKMNLVDGKFNKAFRNNFFKSKALLYKGIVDVYSEETQSIARMIQKDFDGSGLGLEDYRDLLFEKTEYDDDEVNDQINKLKAQYNQELQNGASRKTLLSIYNQIKRVQKQYQRTLDASANNNEYKLKVGNKYIENKDLTLSQKIEFSRVKNLYARTINQAISQVERTSNILIRDTTIFTKITNKNILTKKLNTVQEGINKYADINFISNTVSTDTTGKVVITQSNIETRLNKTITDNTPEGKANAEALEKAGMYITDNQGNQTVNIKEKAVITLDKTNWNNDQQTDVDYTTAVKALDFLSEEFPNLIVKLSLSDTNNNGTSEDVYIINSDNGFTNTLETVEEVKMLMNTMIGLSKVKYLSDIEGNENIASELINSLVAMGFDPNLNNAEYTDEIKSIVEGELNYTVEGFRVGGIDGVSNIKLDKSNPLDSLFSALSVIYRSSGNTEMADSIAAVNDALKIIFNNKKDSTEAAPNKNYDLNEVKLLLENGKSVIEKSVQSNTPTNEQSNQLETYNKALEGINKLLQVDELKGLYITPINSVETTKKYNLNDFDNIPALKDNPELKTKYQNWYKNQAKSLLTLLYNKGEGLLSRDTLEFIMQENDLDYTDFLKSNDQDQKNIGEYFELRDQARQISEIISIDYDSISKADKAKLVKIVSTINNANNNSVYDWLVKDGIVKSDFKQQVDNFMVNFIKGQLQKELGERLPLSSVESVLREKNLANLSDDEIKSMAMVLYNSLDINDKEAVIYKTSNNVYRKFDAREKGDYVVHLQKVNANGEIEYSDAVHKTSFYNAVQAIKDYPQDVRRQQLKNLFGTYYGIKDINDTEYNELIKQIYAVKNNIDANSITQSDDIIESEIVNYSDQFNTPEFVELNSDPTNGMNIENTISFQRIYSAIKKEAQLLKDVSTIPTNKLITIDLSTILPRAMQKELHNTINYLSGIQASGIESVDENNIIKQAAIKCGRSTKEFEQLMQIQRTSQNGFIVFDSSTQLDDYVSFMNKIGYSDKEALGIVKSGISRVPGIYYDDGQADAIKLSLINKLRNLADGNEGSRVTFEERNRGSLDAETALKILMRNYNYEGNTVYDMILKLGKSASRLDNKITTKFVDGKLSFTYTDDSGVEYNMDNILDNTYQVYQTLNEMCNVVKEYYDIKGQGSEGIEETTIHITGLTKDNFEKEYPLLAALVNADVNDDNTLTIHSAKLENWNIDKILQVIKDNNIKNAFKQLMPFFNSDEDAKLNITRLSQNDAGSYTLGSHKTASGSSFYDDIFIKVFGADLDELTGYSKMNNNNYVNEIGSIKDYEESKAIQILNHIQEAIPTYLKQLGFNDDDIRLLVNNATINNKTLESLKDYTPYTDTFIKLVNSIQKAMSENNINNFSIENGKTFAEQLESKIQEISSATGLSTDGIRSLLNNMDTGQFNIYDDEYTFASANPLSKLACILRQDQDGDYYIPLQFLDNIKVSELTMWKEKGFITQNEFDTLIEKMKLMYGNNFDSEPLPTSAKTNISTPTQATKNISVGYASDYKDYDLMLELLQNGVKNKQIFSTPMYIKASSILNDDAKQDAITEAICKKFNQYVFPTTNNYGSVLVANIKNSIMLGQIANVVYSEAQALKEQMGITTNDKDQQIYKIATQLYFETTGTDMSSQTAKYHIISQDDQGNLYLKTISSHSASAMDRTSLYSNLLEAGYFKDKSDYQGKYLLITQKNAIDQNRDVQWIDLHPKNEDGTDKLFNGKTMTDLLRDSMISESVAIYKKFYTTMNANSIYDQVSIALNSTPTKLELMQSYEENFLDEVNRVICNNSQIAMKDEMKEQVRNVIKTSLPILENIQSAAIEQTLSESAVSQFIDRLNSVINDDSESFNFVKHEIAKQAQNFVDSVRYLVTKDSLSLNMEESINLAAEARLNTLTDGLDPKDTSTNVYQTVSSLKDNLKVYTDTNSIDQLKANAETAIQNNIKQLKVELENGHITQEQYDTIVSKTIAYISLSRKRGKDLQAILFATADKNKAYNSIMSQKNAINNGLSSEDKIQIKTLDGKESLIKVKDIQNKRYVISYDVENAYKGNDHNNDILYQIGISIYDTVENKFIKNESIYLKDKMDIILSKENYDGYNFVTGFDPKSSSSELYNAYLKSKGYSTDEARNYILNLLKQFDSSQSVIIGHNNKISGSDIDKLNMLFGVGNNPLADSNYMQIDLLNDIVNRTSSNNETISKARLSDITQLDEFKSCQSEVNNEVKNTYHDGSYDAAITAKVFKKYLDNMNFISEVNSELYKDYESYYKLFTGDDINDNVIKNISEQLNISDSGILTENDRNYLSNYLEYGDKSDINLVASMTRKMEALQLENDRQVYRRAFLDRLNEMSEKNVQLYNHLSEGGNEDIAKTLSVLLSATNTNGKVNELIKDVKNFDDVISIINNTIYKERSNNKEFTMNDFLQLSHQEQIDLINKYRDDKIEAFNGTTKDTKELRKEITDIYLNKNTQPLINQMIMKKVKSQMEYQAGHAMNDLADVFIYGYKDKDGSYNSILPAFVQDNPELVGLLINDFSTLRVINQDVDMNKLNTYLSKRNIIRTNNNKNLQLSMDNYSKNCYSYSGFWNMVSGDDSLSVNEIKVSNAQFRKIFGVTYNEYIKQLPDGVDRPIVQLVRSPAAKYGATRGYYITINDKENAPNILMNSNAMKQYHNGDFDGDKVTIIIPDSNNNINTKAYSDYINATSVIEENLNQLVRQFATVKPKEDYVPNTVIDNAVNILSSENFSDMSDDKIQSLENRINTLDPDGHPYKLVKVLNLGQGRKYLISDNDDLNLVLAQKNRQVLEKLYNNNMQAFIQDKLFINCLSTKDYATGQFDKLKSQLFANEHYSELYNYIIKIASTSEGGQPAADLFQFNTPNISSQYRKSLEAFCTTKENRNKLLTYLSNQINNWKGNNSYIASDEQAFKSMDSIIKYMNTINENGSSDKSSSEFVLNALLLYSVANEANVRSQYVNDTLRNYTSQSSNAFNNQKSNALQMIEYVKTFGIDTENNNITKVFEDKLSKIQDGDLNSLYGLMNDIAETYKESTPQVLRTASPEDRELVDAIYDYTKGKYQKMKSTNYVIHSKNINGNTEYQIDENGFKYRSSKINMLVNLKENKIADDTFLLNHSSKFANQGTNKFFAIDARNINDGALTNDDVIKILDYTESHNNKTADVSLLGNKTKNGLVLNNDLTLNKNNHIVAFLDEDGKIITKNNFTNVSQIKNIILSERLQNNDFITRVGNYKISSEFGSMGKFTYAGNLDKNKINELGLSDIVKVIGVDNIDGFGSNIDLSKANLANNNVTIKYYDSNNKETTSKENAVYALYSYDASIVEDTRFYNTRAKDNVFDDIYIADSIQDPEAYFNVGQYYIKKNSDGSYEFNPKELNKLTTTIDNLNSPNAGHTNGLGTYNTLKLAYILKYIDMSDNEKSQIVINFMKQRDNTSQYGTQFVKQFYDKLKSDKYNFDKFIKEVESNKTLSKLFSTQLAEKFYGKEKVSLNASTYNITSKKKSNEPGTSTYWYDYETSPALMQHGRLYSANDDPDSADLNTSIGYYSKQKLLNELLGTTNKGTRLTNGSVDNWTASGSISSLKGIKTNLSNGYEPIEMIHSTPRKGFLSGKQTSKTGAPSSLLNANENHIDIFGTTNGNLTSRPTMTDQEYNNYFNNSQITNTVSRIRNKEYIGNSNNNLLLQLLAAASNTTGYNGTALTYASRFGETPDDLTMSTGHYMINPYKDTVEYKPETERGTINDVANKVIGNTKMNVRGMFKRLTDDGENELKNVVSSASEIRNYLEQKNTTDAITDDALNKSYSGLKQTFTQNQQQNDRRERFIEIFESNGEVKDNSEISQTSDRVTKNLGSQSAMHFKNDVFTDSGLKIDGSDPRTLAVDQAFPGYRATKEQVMMDLLGDDYVYLCNYVDNSDNGEQFIKFYTNETIYRQLKQLANLSDSQEFTDESFNLLDADTKLKAIELFKTTGYSNMQELNRNLNLDRSLYKVQYLRMNAIFQRQQQYAQYYGAKLNLPIPTLVEMMTPITSNDDNLNSIRGKSYYKNIFSYSGNKNGFTAKNMADYNPLATVAYRANKLSQMVGIYEMSETFKANNAMQNIIYSNPSMVKQIEDYMNSNDTSLKDKDKQITDIDIDNFIMMQKSIEEKLGQFGFKGFTFETDIKKNTKEKMMSYYKQMYIELMNKIKDYGSPSFDTAVEEYNLALIRYNNTSDDDIEAKERYNDQRKTYENILSMYNYAEEIVLRVSNESTDKSFLDNLYDTFINKYNSPDSEYVLVDSFGRKLPKSESDAMNFKSITGSGLDSYLYYMQHTKDGGVDFKKQIALDMLHGDVYIMDKNLANKMDFMFQETDKNVLQKAISVSKQYAMKLLMANPMKLPSRFINFTAYDMENAFLIDKRSLTYLPRAQKRINAFMQSGGAVDDPEIKEWLSLAGNNLTGSTGLVDGETFNNDSILTKNKTLNTIFDGTNQYFQEASKILQEQNALTRFATWLSLKERFDSAEAEYPNDPQMQLTKVAKYLGSAYHYKDVINALETSGEKAEFIISQSYGDINHQPYAARWLSDKGAVFTTFPMYAMRFAKNGLENFSTCVKDIFVGSMQDRSEAISFLSNRVSSAAILMAITVGLASIATSAKDTVSKDKDKDGEVSKDEELQDLFNNILTGSGPDLFQSLLNNEYISNTSTSWNPWSTVYKMTINPIIEGYNDSKEDGDSNGEAIAKGAWNFTKEELLSHINPLFKDAVDIVAPNAISNYNSSYSTDSNLIKRFSENLGRKALGYTIGSSATNAFIDTFKTRSSDENIMDKIIEGYKNALIAESGNTKSYKSDWKTYNNAMNIYYTYMTALYQDSDYDSSSSSSYNKFKKAIKTNSTPTELYNLIMEEYNNCSSTEEVKDMVKQLSQCSLRYKIANMGSYKNKFLNSLTDSERSIVNTALGIEDMFYPWLDDTIADIQNEVYKDSDTSTYTYSPTYNYKKYYNTYNNTYNNYYNNKKYSSNNNSNLTGLVSSLGNSKNNYYSGSDSYSINNYSNNYRYNNYNTYSNYSRRVYNNPITQNTILNNLTNQLKGK